MAVVDYIEAREFDFLTRLDKGKPGCHDLTNDQFAALRSFVLSNAGEDGNAASDLMRLCSPAGIGEAIQLRNYVGVIEFADGLQIEVLPKIDIAAGSDVPDDREVFLRMLTALGSDVSFKLLDGSHLASDNIPLFEVFVGMFLDEAENLARVGLKSAYVETRGELGFVKGKIDFAQQVKQGVLHAERISVVFDEFKLDRPENRLIKTTLKFLKGRTRTDDFRRRITRLLPAFEGVGISHNIDSDFSRCVSDRATKRYGTLLGWCRVFLKGESFTMFRGGNIATALLFPMERIFEDYVGKTLRQGSIRRHALSGVDLQAQTEWLFDDRRIALRPDILCRCRDGRCVVLDTKWKRVEGRRDLSVADMHQMYAYGQRYRSEGESTQHVMLLFPWHKGVRPGLLKSGRHTSCDGVQIDMFYVDLANMNASLDELLGLIEDPGALED